jgi:hypothetical protein
MAEGPGPESRSGFYYIEIPDRSAFAGRPE